MIVLDNLKSLGYDVEVKEDNIRLSYKGEGKPDKNRVLPLLEELKSKKNEAIKELKQARKTYKIYSKILDDFLWVTATNTEMKKMLDEGIEEPIYTYDDVVNLEGISKEGLKAIHKIKRVFPGSTVEDIKHKNKD
jgi:hypothetical protein